MTAHTLLCRAGVTAVLITSVALMATAAAPEGVSPGSQDRFAAVESGCPTFNWAAVPATAYYELVAYALPDIDELDGEQELQLTDEAEVLYATVPGGANGWTPDAEHCLSPGIPYVWFVRSVAATENGDATEPGEWSEGLFFFVVNLDSRDQAWDLPASDSASSDRLEPRARATDKGPVDDPWVLVSGDVMTGPLGIDADGLNVVSLVTGDDESTGNVTKLEVRSTRGRPLLTVDSEGDLKAGSFSGGPVDADQLSVGGSTVVDSDGDWVGNGDTLPCAGCVSTADLANDAITSSKIANYTIATADLHDNIVNHTKILDGTIQSADLSAGAVTADKIAPGAVGTVALVDGGVTSSDLANGSVTSSKIAANAVNGYAIASGSITAIDVAPLGGIYSTRDALYVVESEMGVSAGGSMSQWTVHCNDSSDLPVSGGCRAQAFLDLQDLDLRASYAQGWDDPTVVASQVCAFRNQGSAHLIAVASIVCINVP